MGSGFEALFGGGSEKLRAWTFLPPPQRVHVQLGQLEHEVRTYLLSMYSRKL